jgi:hypothetical protein
LLDCLNVPFQRTNFFFNVQKQIAHLPPGY